MGCKLHGEKNHIREKLKDFNAVKTALKVFNAVKTESRVGEQMERCCRQNGR
jgi:hypothetical protein